MERFTKESETRVCPSCENKYSAVFEFCPLCLLRGALSPSSTEDLDQVGPGSDDVSTRYQFENYEILKNPDGTPLELGRGAMGVTYKAIDTDLRCQVAIKVIGERYLNQESARARFVQEARAAASIRHPNIAAVYRLGKSGSNYFYAMEFVEGESLRNLLERTGRLDLKLALAILTQVAAGLAALHKQNLVHRDIKPANIMVNVQEEESLTVKIIDLGLAKRLDALSNDAYVSVPGAFVGTPEFASPEQIRGVDIDIRSDLYSLGITFWIMITGRVPFQGSPMDVITQHQHSPLPLQQIDDIPQPVALLLQRLLQKDPTLRFQVPSELVKAIPKVLEALEGKRCLDREDLETVSESSPGNSSNRLRVRSVSNRGAVRKKIHFLFRSRTSLWITAGVFIVPILIFLFSHRFADNSRSSPYEVRGSQKSIAVLPFESLSESKSDAYFADGIQDEILSKLAKVSQLRVISRTSVMGYRPDGRRDLRSIAKELGVANVVEGTVRRDEKHVRITTELVDARTDETLWSDSYDGYLTDVFAIQAEIAQSVAAKLSARLTPQEGSNIVQTPTADLDAFVLYLQAKELVTTANLVLGESSRFDYLRAIELLDEATRKDPRFALAFCLMARAHDALYADEFDRTPERRSLGDAAVKQALRLRPDLPEVTLEAAFHLYTCYQDYEGARTRIDLAATKLPNNPELFALIAKLDRRQGNWERAITGFEKAVSLDPRNPEILVQLELTYRYARRYEDAERIINCLVEIQPHNPVFGMMSGRIKLNAKADLGGYRSALDTSLSQGRTKTDYCSELFIAALFSRDWTAAKEALGVEGQFYFFEGLEPVPRTCLEIWLALLKGEHPETNASLAAARDELGTKVNAHPEDSFLLSVLGIVDAALGSKQKGISEAKQAVEAMPMTRDALAGARVLFNLAVVYTWADQPDLALETLKASAERPAGVTYGELKLDPAWDPIRGDDRFHRLLTELVSKN
jgi:serine/threonine protein kinase